MAQNDSVEAARQQADEAVRKASPWVARIARTAFMLVVARYRNIEAG